MSYQKLTTPKLFYKKHLFKIRCSCNGAWMIKRLGTDETIDQCKNVGRLIGIHRIDPVKLLNFLMQVEPFINREDVQIRTQSSIFSIYCNEKSLFDDICKALDPWITQVFVPANNTELNFMQDNEHKKVLCNKLPFKRYQYKVYLKTVIKQETRLDFLAWLSKYQGKIKSPRGVNRWLTGRALYASNPYIYVEDEKLVMLVRIFLGKHISKVEELVPRSMINTQSEEELCLV